MPIKANERIAILMATYNGDRFLSEQLDSLFSQTDNGFTVFIRDDGSTDNTLELIKNYADRFPGRIMLMDDKTLNRGAKDSFLWLLEHVDAEYFMFCDQDDVWLPFKVEHTRLRMEEIEKKNPDKGVMIHTDMKMVDANLNETFPSFWKWSKFMVDLNKRFAFAALQNVFTGCTMMINNRAKEYVFPVNKKVHMHDEWVGLTVVKYGVVDNLKEQTMLYRRHGNNVTPDGERKEYKIKNYSGFDLNEWYMYRKEVLDSLNYGSKTKAIANKVIYSLIRMLFA